MSYMSIQSEFDEPGENVLSHKYYNHAFGGIIFMFSSCKRSVSELYISYIFSHGKILGSI